MNWHRLRKWRKTIHHLCNSIFVELNFKHCSIRKEYNLNRTFMDSIIACHVSTWSLCQMSTDRIALTYRCTASYYTSFHRVSVGVGWEWKGSVTPVPQSLDYAHETQYTHYINSVSYKPTLTYWLYSQFWKKTRRSSACSGARSPQQPDCHYHCLQAFDFSTCLEEMRKLLSCSCSAQKVSLERQKG